MLDTQYKEIIDIEHTPLSNEKNIEPITLRIILTNNYIQYEAEYYSDTPKDTDDLSLGWETKYVKFNETIRLSMLTAIDCRYLSKDNCYAVEMEFAGRKTSLFLYFNTEKEASIVKEKILLLAF